MLEYIEEEHLYLYNGIIIPSVSQLLHERLFKDKYINVPKEILNKKSIYGQQIHKAIEDLENNIEYHLLSIYQELSIEQYLKLKEKYNIEVLEQEKIVCYKGIYAGRYDMVANVNSELSLIDIKTTAELDLEYLSWQLSLYELADGRKFDKFYALWLPRKNIGKLIEIPRKSKKQIIDLLKRCELL